CTCTPDHFEPGNGVFLQRELGISDIPAIDVRNQCSGFLYGLSVADAWIRTGAYRRILLVGAEVHSRGLDKTTRGRDTAVLFGDGAGAVVLGPTDDPRRVVLSVHLFADGRHAEKLWVDGPGPTRCTPTSTGTATPPPPRFPSRSTRRSPPGGSAAAISSSSPHSAPGSPGPARPSAGNGSMLAIDLKGKRAFVAGVSDDGGFGFAIAKALAEAGASICLGSWPPALGIFTKLLERGKIADSLQLSDGRTLQFERIYPLDAAYDSLTDAPADVRENKRYKDVGDFSVQGVVARLSEDFGARPLDIVVHSLANAPEVKQ